MIFKNEEVKRSSNYVGSKALRLAELSEAGFFVPNFVAIPSNVSDNLLNQHGEINKRELAALTEKLMKIFKEKSVAVRSSALVEDCKTESMAGQFKTVLNVKHDELRGAIEKLLIHANTLLKGEMKLFSFIVQEYIEPDYAGVAFSRNPLGGREMILEYQTGQGHGVVSGTVKPKRLEFFWESKSIVSEFKCQNKLIESIKKIENLYNFPQDIEWCVEDNQLYILQTRSITSLCEKDYIGIKCLEEFLPDDELFYFEKTAISEIAPRPSTVTKDLLKMIYSENGPISQVYNKYNVKYFQKDFLKIIGNELFVDKEKELHTLFPSHTLLKNKNFRPGFKRVEGLGASIKNFIKINKISIKNVDNVFEALKRVINKSNESKSFENSIDRLLNDYKIVFEINLLAGVTVSRLNAFIKKEKNITISDIFDLSGHPAFCLEKYLIDFEDSGMTGNSFDVADESEFIYHVASYNSDCSAVKWWEELSPFEKKYYEKVILNALIMNRLREYGRCLVVKRVSSLRSALFQVAIKNQFKDLRNIYFEKISDILQGRVKEDISRKRHEEYKRYNKYSFENCISSYKKENKDNTPIGVSTGLATGVLVSKQEVDKTDGELILYVKSLTPDLVEYFKKVKGIISEQGGMLSHLAIIAREKKIPVVVNFDLNGSGIEVGEKVRVDGSSGDISCLS